MGKKTGSVSMYYSGAIALIIALLALFESRANQAPVLHTEDSNLKKALYCMDILENRPDLRPERRIAILREDCFAESYVQHSPHVADGREVVLNLFKNRYENSPEISTSIKRTAADGDLVWLHQHVKRSSEDRGRAVVNIFRMSNGKFAEHWNVVQEVPERSKNQNTMF